MRATIKLNNDNSVSLVGENPVTGEEINWVFDLRGEHIWWDDGRQVCEGLADRGLTLWAETPEQMLRTIRRNWREYRRNAIREFQW